MHFQLPLLRPRSRARDREPIPGDERRSKRILAAAVIGLVIVAGAIALAFVVL